MADLLLGLACAGCKKCQYTANQCSGDAFSSNDDGSLYRIVFKMWLKGKSLLIWAGVPRVEGIAALARRWRQGLCEGDQEKAAQQPMTCLYDLLS